MKFKKIHQIPNRRTIPSRSGLTSKPVHDLLQASQDLRLFQKHLMRRWFNILRQSIRHDEIT